MTASKTYTFNRPWALIFLSPVAFLIFMLVEGLLNEFSLFVLVMVIATTLVLLLFLHLTILRRVTLSKEKIIWKTIFKTRSFDLQEIQNFGIVKFRKFRFIYFTRLENPPYGKEDTPVVTTEETIVLQFRQKAWQQTVEIMEAAHPGLKPKSFA